MSRLVAGLRQACLCRSLLQRYRKHKPNFVAGLMRKNDQNLSLLNLQGHSKTFREEYIESD